MDLIEFQAYFGKNLQLIRKKRGLTQEQMGIDPRYYQRIESGEKNVTLKTVLHLCKELNVEPKDLFDFKMQFPS